MRLNRFAGALLVACAVALVGPVAANAATFTVNATADDSSAPSGTATTCPSTCTLRDAVIAANNTSGDNTIVLPAGHYTLSIAPSNPTNGATTGDLNVTSGDSLTINGAGADSTTIDGGSIDRVFHVESGATLNLTGATVTGGSPASTDSTLVGGGFLDNGTLSLSADVVSGDQSPAGFGGGINVTDGGSATVANSTFSSNTAGSATASFSAGGGIHVDSGSTDSLTVTDSTFTGNVADSTGGSDGGALDLDGGTDTITNSTLTGNSAGGVNPGGGAVDTDTSQPVQFTSDTVAFNTQPDDTNAAGSPDGAGIWVTGSNVQASNTIVADNTRGTSTGTETQNCANATIVSDPGNNLDNDSTCFGGTHDLHADPQLSALASNGGSTQTLAIAATSPARDAADGSTCQSTDQRGVARPVGSACDIGAFELDPPVNTAAPAISGTAVNLQKLSCSQGNWGGSPFQSYAYQWKRNGTAISGATSSSYTVSAADVGQQLTCTVTASTPGDGSASATSAAVTPAFPSNKFSFGKLSHNKRKGTATLTVKLAGPGAVVLKGKGVKTVHKTVSGGRVKLTIKLTGKLARELKAMGKLKVRIAVTYTPTGGLADKKHKKITLIFKP